MPPDMLMDLVRLPRRTLALKVPGKPDVPVPRPPPAAKTEEPAKPDKS